MSLLVVKEVRDAIRTACGLAWGLSEDDVVYGEPHTVRDLPYAVVRLDSVPMEPETVCCVEQTYQYEIDYIAKFSEGDVIEDVKVEKANALIAQLMQGSVFAGVARSPVIREVSFAESDNQDEPIYRLSVLFTVIVDAEWLVS